MVCLQCGRQVTNAHMVRVLIFGRGATVFCKARHAVQWLSQFLHINKDGYEQDDL